MDRILHPELLDELPAGDPAAISSRRDLRVLNHLMGHRGILLRALRGLARTPPHRLVDLGAGDGSLSLWLATRLAPGWPGVELVLVDRQPVVPATTLAEIRRLGWSVEVRAEEAGAWAAGPPVAREWVLANLFLHHFADGPLRALLAALAVRATGVVALEPRRAAWPLFACLMIRFIGANHVTRHDARVSVRAGFRGRELARLWPDSSRWCLEERRSGPFSHCFTAVRSECD